MKYHLDWDDPLSAVKNFQNADCFWPLIGAFLLKWAGVIAAGAAVAGAGAGAYQTAAAGRKAQGAKEDAERQQALARREASERLAVEQAEKKKAAAVKAAADKRAADLEAGIQADTEAAMIRKRSLVGLAATVRTGPAGLRGRAPTEKKSLLGQGAAY